jgi:hypothetical protein
MKRQLNFSVPPVRKVFSAGNPDTGIIELPICGGLLRKEREILAALTQTDETLYMLSAKIAAKISQLEGISISEAFAAIQGGAGDTPELKDLRVKYSEDMQTVINASIADIDRYKIAAVTAVMKVRGGMPEWEVSDWDGQPDAIIDGIYKLVEMELGAEPVVTVTAPTDEALGKPPTGSAHRRSTGKPATGI